MLDNINQKFRHYDTAKLSQIRQGLVQKGALKDDNTKYKNQLAFAHAVEKSCSDFVSYFHDTHFSEISLPISFRNVSHPLTGQEIANPPLETEILHYDLLKELPPNLAALTSFWTSYQLEMVRLELIDPADIATSRSKSNETGRARLEKAIQASENNNIDQLDKCVRTILRQLGGLPEVRGYVSVFVDCWISRGWWRGFISNQVAEDLNLNWEKVWKHLRITDATWDQLIQHAVKRLTVVSDRNVRSAAIARLIESNIDQDNSRNKRSRVQDFLAKIGVQNAYYVLGAMTPQENLEIFRKIKV